MVELVEYFCAFTIGVFLGLTGGGGSILTVPVLVYVIHLNPIIASAYSLFIVGVTSSFGTVINILKKNVVFKTGFFLAIPSTISIFITRKFIVHSIPEVLFENTNFIITKNFFLMVLFAIVMFFAAISMLKTVENIDNQNLEKKQNLLLVFVQIFCVGILIGLIGAGGGFLIIPALSHFAKFPIKKAIGTSLFMIALNSLIGFYGDVQNINVDWIFLIRFAGIAVIGIFVGVYISKYFNEKNLKKIFGYFVLMMAVFVLTKEMVF